MIAPYECYKSGTLPNLFVLLNNSYANWISYTCQGEYCNFIQQRGKFPDHSVSVLLFAPQAFTENLDVILIKLCFVVYIKIAILYKM